MLSRTEYQPQRKTATKCKRDWQRLIRMNDKKQTQKKKQKTKTQKKHKTEYNTLALQDEIPWARRELL